MAAPGQAKISTCPKCQGRDLQEVPSAPGLLVDVCRSCRGVWLDQSEIYRFVPRPHALYQELSRAYRSTYPSSFSCPRCERMMLHAQLETGDLVLEVCPACGGTWFDAGEVEKLQRELAEAVPESRQKRSAGAAASTGGVSAGGELAGGRLTGEQPLAEAEAVALFGGDVAGALRLVAGLGCAAGVVSLPGHPSEAVILLLFSVAALIGLHVASDSKRSRLREARLVQGTVTRLRTLPGSIEDLEVEVRYVLAGRDHQVTLRISSAAFPEVREGGVIGVAAVPGRFDGARLVRGA